MNNNLVCASRSPFAAGVKAHCPCWQQGLNSPPSAAQPSGTDTTELQELATVLPMNQLLRRAVSNSVQICWNSHFTVGASERVLLHVMADALDERAWQLSQTKQ